MKTALLSLLCVSILSANFSGSALTGKLFGGRDLVHKEANYLAYITHKDVHKFSGCLISKKHVLTAAHNLENFWLKHIIPFFGDYHVVVGSSNASMTGKKFSIEQVQANRYYVPRQETSTHNIAVITMMESIDRSSSANPIGLNVYDPMTIGVEAMGIGWASHAEGEMCAQQNMPKGTNLRMRMKGRCGRGNKAAIFCTGIVDNNDRFCMTDIGAPLIKNEKVIGVLIDISLNNPVIYNAFTEKSAREISSMQIKMKDVRQFLLRYTNEGPRKKARWEQNEWQRLQNAPFEDKI